MPEAVSHPRPFRQLGVRRSRGRGQAACAPARTGALDGKSCARMVRSCRAHDHSCAGFRGPIRRRNAPPTGHVGVVHRRSSARPRGLADPFSVTRTPWGSSSRRSVRTGRTRPGRGRRRGIVEASVDVVAVVAAGPDDDHVLHEFSSPVRCWRGADWSPSSAPVRASAARRGDWSPGWTVRGRTPRAGGWGSPRAGAAAAGSCRRHR